MDKLLVAGSDGCRYGWVVVQKNLEIGATNLHAIPTFREVVAATANVFILAVDIPIGLLEAARPRGRACDILGRDILGKPRRSSIFSPPVRSALCASSYPEALRINRDSSLASIGISQQCYGLFKKLREVDNAMSPELQYRVREVHPELCFREMNNGKPIQEPKKSPEGFRRRMEIIKESGFPQVGDWLRCYPKTQVAADDILDACAACWTAERIHCGVAVRVPSEPEKDSRGLHMEMWV